MLGNRSVKIKRVYSDPKGFHKIVYSENDKIESEAYITIRARQLLDEGIQEGFQLLQVFSAVSGDMLRFIITPEDLPELLKKTGVSEEEVLKEGIDFRGGDEAGGDA